MKKVVLPDNWLVIGPGSLVGSKFVEITADGGNIYGAGSSLDASNALLQGFNDLDITNSENVSAIIENFPGKYVINFAGITAVDEVEKTKPVDPTDISQLKQNLAYKVNVIGTRNVIHACKQFNKFPVFISTGFVFDGQNGPYSEDDQIADDPSKVGWYAWTKILAEKEVENSGIENITIRPSYPYRTKYKAKGDFARNFLNLYDLVEKGEKSWYPVFTDQTLTPTFTDDFPMAVKTLIENNAIGIYHLTSPEITTPYEFCCEILRVARGVENPAEIVPKGSLIEFQKEYPKLAKRPLKGGEKTDKIQKLGFTPTSWKDGIQKAFGK